MTGQDGGEQFVCHDCIDDEFLADEVRERGTGAPCFHCGDSREAWSIEDLANRIAEVLHKHFRYTAEEYHYGITASGTFDWIPAGGSIDEVIAEMARIDYDIAFAIVEHLYQLTRWDVIKEGETDYYDYDAHYEALGADDQGFHHTWRDFCDEIKSRARFFSSSAEGMLSNIFGDLDSHLTREGEPVVRQVGPEVEDRFVWRARKAESAEELKTILKTPAREIGPPPTECAGDGRMNARGISVFYGAFEKATCVAEIRPPVGSYVVTGKFEVVRELRLLDLDLLADVHDWVSHFNPDYIELKGRVAFLRFLVDEISRPVMPDDEASEYLPTQAVAEYLANRVEPPLDGIIFRSTQTGSVGRNLVLFNHASAVDFSESAYQANKEIIDISLPQRICDKEDSTIFIWEREVSSSSDGSTPGGESTAEVLPTPVSALHIPKSRLLGTHTTPTLKLDSECIDVSCISAVQYFEVPYDLIRDVMRDAPPDFDVDAIKKILGKKF